MAIPPDLRGSTAIIVLDCIKYRLFAALMRLPERIALTLLLGLGIWVITTAIRIEVLNAEAGYYLPSGNDGNGKWPVYGNNTARNQLHGMIQTIGLLQYVLAPILVIAAIASFFRFRCFRARLVAGVAGAFGCVALGLALYRGYLPALGW